MLARALAVALPFALALPALAADAAAATATAGSATASAAAPEKPKAEPLPLHGTAGMTNSAGTGTFVVGGGYANQTIQSQLSLGGSLKINEDWSANVSERVGFEWTDSDNTTYAHQLELTDPRFGVSFNALKVKDLGLGVSLSGGYALPITMASRNAGSIGSLGLGSRVSWDAPMLTGFAAYGALNAGYAPQIGALAAGYAAARDASDFTASNGEQTRALNCANGARPGDVENFACSGTPRWRWGVGAGASYSITEQLTASIDLTYGQSLATQGYSKTVTLADGTVVEDTQSPHATDFAAPSISTSGSLGLTWTPVPWFSLTGGTFTAQPATSDNGHTLRWFPLWDLGTFTPGGANNNFSSVYIDTTFQI